MTLHEVIRAELQALLAPPPPPEVMTVAQACEWLQISPPTLRRLGLPYVLVGDSKRYIREDVLAWLRAQPPAPPCT